MKDIPTSPRIAQIKRNRRAERVRLIILLSILFISIIVALSYFSSNPKITINKIIVTGNSIIDKNDLESSIQNRLSGKYLKLFSRANFLLYPNKRIYNDLINKFPRIKSLTLKREGLNTLHLNIVERTGSYLYCGLVLPVNKDDVGENCYFINNDGYIFDKAPYFSGNIYFKYYMKIDGDSMNPQGKQMLSPDLFHKLVSFIDGVTALGFKPSCLVVTDDGMYSLYLKSVNNGVNPKIIFNEDNDLSLILDNFSIAMSKEEFANEINQKYDTLSYIDLRFKDKVLYKFQ